MWAKLSCVFYWNKEMFWTLLAYEQFKTNEILQINILIKDTCELPTNSPTNSESRDQKLTPKLRRWLQQGAGASTINN